jgi:FkbM family methyltransferase
LLGWNSLSTAAKVRLARALYRGLIALRAIRGLPQVVVAARRGVVFELDLAEGIDLAMYLGIYEFNTHRALRRLVREGDVVLDIGANVGVHTLPLALMVGEIGRVIAFEPTSFAFSRLLRNLQLNPAISGRVTPVMAYLDDGRRNGDPAAFYSRWPLNDTKSQHPLHKGFLEDARGAAGWTLDEYESTARIGRVAVMKLDVDGSECEVLRGATQLLMRDHPSIVTELCPYALEEHGDSAEALLEVLSNHGYSIYDERTLALMPRDPKLIKASIRRHSSINVVALAGPAASEEIASRSANPVRP